MEKVNSPIILYLNLISPVKKEIKSAPTTPLLMFFTGTASKQWYSKYLYSVVFLLGMSLTYAIGAFPDTYKIRVHYISTLGVVDCNPDGYWMFNIGLILVGLLLIPVFIFQFRCDTILDHSNKQLKDVISRYTMFISIISAFGFVIVGFFPAQYKTPHIFGAALVFIGMYIVNNIRFTMHIGKIVLISDKKRRLFQQILHYTYLILFNLIGFSFLLALAIDQQIFLVNPLLNSILSPSLWEWIYFLTIISLFFHWIAPNFNEQLERKRHLIPTSNKSALQTYHYRSHSEKLKMANRSEQQINS